MGRVGLADPFLLGPFLCFFFSSFNLFVCFSFCFNMFCSLDLHSYMLQSMLGCQIYRFRVLLYLLCCQGFWAKSHVRIILAACAGQIMCTQGCSCMRTNQPRNPNFILSIFVSIFTCNTPVQTLFHVFILLSFCFICVIVYLPFTCQNQGLSYAFFLIML